VIEMIIAGEGAKLDVAIAWNNPPHLDFSDF
jgi:hypothetical protein